MKVLITSFRCSFRTGLEVYVRDLAVALRERGHVPIIYSPELGELAQEFHRLTIPVVDNLDSIGAPPDIIHGHHHMETMTALLHFPNVPAIYFCHDWFSPLDSPPSFPRILRYAAVDQSCLEKLVFGHAVPEERVQLLFNFIDEAKFKLRTPLPAQPKRALLYCNYTDEDANLAAVREACATAGLELDVVGGRMGNSSKEPEKLLRNYDIVFAKSRAAAEALAVGTAVIVYCMRSVGPMVTANQLEHLLPLNFGIRAMKNHTSAQGLTEHLCREIARYDPRDATEVSAKVRNLLGRKKCIDEILRLYEEVIAEQRNRGRCDPAVEARAAAAYILWLSSRVRENFNVRIGSPLVTSAEPLEAVLDTLEVAQLGPPEETVLNNPAVMLHKRPFERVWSNPTVVRLKRRFVRIPMVGKPVHSFALRLIGPRH